ncbi:Uncharacterised protein [Mycobacterium tuberculosis]|nr:Uncharacterised protein [Mycobacterium tuberculosis]
MVDSRVDVFALFFCFHTQRNILIKVDVSDDIDVDSLPKARRKSKCFNDVNVIWI